MKTPETLKYIGQPRKWFTDCCLVAPIKPIGYLHHEPTGYSLAVYKPISRFKRLMLRWCFGLKFEKI